MRPFLGTHVGQHLGEMLLGRAIARLGVVEVDAVVEVAKPEAVVELMVQRHFLQHEVRAKNARALQGNAKRNTTLREEIRQSVPRSACC